MKVLRLVISFLAAAVFATVGLSIVSSHNVIGNLANMGYPLSASEKIDMYLTDFAGFAPAAGAVNILGLLIAFGLATLIIRMIWNKPSVGYPLAGGVALWAEMVAMQLVYENTPIAGARTTGGMIAIVLVGVMAGFIFNMLRKKPAA